MKYNKCINCVYYPYLIRRLKTIVDFPYITFLLFSNLFNIFFNRNIKRSIGYSQFDDRFNEISDILIFFFPSFLASRRILFVTQECRAFRI